jgi:hypothetical protein
MVGENSFPEGVFPGKRIAVVVAHQDDEVLFFGGTLLRRVAYTKVPVKLLLVCCYQPSAGRKDTYTRTMAFNEVAKYLGAEAVHLWNPNRIPLNDVSLTGLAESLATFNPDTIFTHNIHGEYGHEEHKEVYKAMDMFETDLWVSSVGTRAIKGHFTADFSRPQKEKLFQFYAPQWTPKRYKFAYEPETLLKLSPASTLTQPSSGGPECDSE